MEPGKYVTHLLLAGLHPEDAYTLASRLLEYLDINRAKAPYAELRDLLKQLDYHPLAIQLVLPALREMSLSLAKIKVDFAALLPKFKDDLETGRNGSLLASLDFSLRRLSEEQRALLPRLAVFEGGASEDDLLAITEIPESEWVKLRPDLERAALLTAEQVANFTAPFLRFHPVLAPYLRSLQGADDEALRERYAERYYGVARYLYREDNHNPQAVRALLWLELPNLRRALELLLDAGELNDASKMADCIAKFLNAFGLMREVIELRKRVGKAVAIANTQSDGKLTRAEWLHEGGLGEDEYNNGNLHAAYARFIRLLERIEMLPDGTPFGRGSYEHCITIQRLARCLNSAGQPAAAEVRLHEAMIVVEALIKQEPENQGFIRQRGALLTELGNVQTEQGRYSQAQEAYEGALKIDEQLGDLRNQAVDLGQLGTLMVTQRNYSEGRKRHTEAREIFHALGEPRMEAVAWHQLGRVAEQQEDWSEAERCYRESLAIKERLGDAALAATSCNQLAIVAENSGRPVEAEGWWKRALELIEKVNPGGSLQAAYFSNLASLLMNEVKHSRADRTRLAEARRYAEQALAIDETLDVSSEIWKDFAILANIAELEGRAEEARNYHRRERETYDTFEGNRYHIDRQFGQFIADVAAAGKGNIQMRAKVEAELPNAEKNGWPITNAIHRIWAGERDWHTLTESMGGRPALLIKRVLEILAQPEETQNMTPEQVIASLPEAIREALERGDQAAFEKAFGVLSQEEQQAVVVALQFLQSQQGEEDEDDGDVGESEE